MCFLPGTCRDGAGARTRCTVPVILLRTVDGCVKTTHIDARNTLEKR
ncbi:hypothetical protein BSIN_4901 [Burkholderia singularis]|uniref:Uncharacterized protein n=1 Tax=Burkholderia singularis TaxID=1503053 RepID=A0A238HAP8_9BURK|nr:hypothetical protein BSIN_4901 [Burkholderia singularis]